MPGAEWMMSERVIIRPARADEAEQLTGIAMRSKAYWGYGQAFLEAVHPLLTVTEADLGNSRTHVATVAGEPIGFYRLSGTLPQGALEDLWIEPRFIHRGIGRRLFKHALRVAADAGFDSLVIESDPNAEGFYRLMGATRIGERRSTSGRTVPLLRVST